MLQSLIVIGSEITLALYPILVKLVPTTLLTQIFSRFLVYTVLGAVLLTAVGGGSGIADTLFSQTGFQRSALISALNLTHVYASYTAFTELSAGSSMTLFYTYPIWILLFSALFYGEKFTPSHLALVSLAFVGTILVAQDTKEESFKDMWNWRGILAALGAALTEAGIYFAVKSSEHTNPFVEDLELYALGLVGLAAYIGIQKEEIDKRLSSWTPLVLFNVIIGFIGYCLRFYAIPRVSTALFSILSFVGVVASFSWGRIFVNEVPTIKTLLGAGLITAAAGASVFLKS